MLGLSFLIKCNVNQWETPPIFLIRFKINVCPFYDFNNCHRPYVQFSVRKLQRIYGLKLHFYFNFPFALIQTFLHYSKQYWCNFSPKKKCIKGALNLATSSKPDSKHGQLLHCSFFLSVHFVYGLKMFSKKKPSNFGAFVDLAAVGGVNGV